MVGLNWWIVSEPNHEAVEMAKQYGPASHWQKRRRGPAAESLSAWSRHVVYAKARRGVTDAHLVGVAAEILC
jgi:hypothetical protein